MLIKVRKERIKGYSMNPLIKMGSSLLINTGFKKITIGDIVIFHHKGKLVAHRIIGIRYKKNAIAYLIKGDSRFKIDACLSRNKIFAKVEKIIYPNYTIDLGSRKSQVLKYFFVLYSRLILKFPCFIKLKSLYKIPFFKKIYRFLVKNSCEFIQTKEKNKEIMLPK